MPAMKSKTKKAKKPPSKKGAAERVFSASFDASGKLTAVNYRVAVPVDKLKLKHVGNLVRLMFAVGKALAESHGETQKDSLEFEKSEDNELLFNTALKRNAKATWSKELFGIKEVSDNPFNGGDWQRFGFDLCHKNAPTSVRIEMNGKTIDSRTSAPADFEEVPKESATAVTTRNYAAAFGKVVVKAAADFSKSLSSHSYPVADPFKYAGDVMRTIENTPGLMCLDMHLMSVIPPSAWFQVSDWSAHHENVQKLAAKAGANKFDRRQRRIHALDEDLLMNPTELLSLADLLLCDHHHHIESRVLAVTKHKADASGAIQSVDDVLLMDYGIFSTGTGEYGVIISNIPPFRDGAPKGFQVFDFPRTDRQALYYFMRHNWHKAWWDNIKGAKMKYTVDVLQLVLEISEGSELKDLPELWYFESLNTAKEGVLAAVKKAVKQVMDKAEATGGKQDELKFRKWFEKDGKTFRNSLKANGTK